MASPTLLATAPLLVAGGDAASPFAYPSGIYQAQTTYRSFDGGGTWGGPSYTIPVSATDYNATPATYRYAFAHTIGPQVNGQWVGLHTLNSGANPYALVKADSSADTAAFVQQGFHPGSYVAQYYFGNIGQIVHTGTVFVAIAGGGYTVTWTVDPNYGWASPGYSGSGSSNGLPAVPQVAIWSSMCAEGQSGRVMTVAKGSSRGAFAVFDGVSDPIWVPITLPAVYQWTTVLWSGMNYVLFQSAATNEYTYTSPSAGGSWTPRGMPVSHGAGWPYAATNGGGLVIAHDTYGYTAVSTDGGNTWGSGGALPAVGTWGDIVYDGIRFYILYSPFTLSARLATSVDGVSWAWVNGALPAYTSAIYAFAPSSSFISGGVSTAYASGTGGTINRTVYSIGASYMQGEGNIGLQSSFSSVGVATCNTLGSRAGISNGVMVGASDAQAYATTAYPAVASAAGTSVTAFVPPTNLGAALTAGVATTSFVGAQGINKNYFAGNLKSIKGSFTATFGIRATFATTLPALTASFAGGTYSLGGVLPPVICSFAAASSIVGYAQMELPRITASFSAVSRTNALLAGYVAPIRASFTARMGTLGTLAATTPKLTGNFTALAGKIGTLSSTLPVITGSFTGYSANVATMAAVLPRISGAFTARLTTAQVMTLVVNTITNSTVTYEQYPYNSFAEFGGKYLAAGPSGLYQLETGNDDTGAQIAAHITTGQMSFNSEFQKHVTDFYAGARTDDDLLLTVFIDENDPLEYTLSPLDIATLNQRRSLIGKGARGKYWQFDLANTNGCNFDIDTMNVSAVPSERRI